MLVALVIGDWYMRNAEMDKLVSAVARAEYAESDGYDKILSRWERTPEYRQNAGDAQWREVAGRGVVRVSSAMLEIEDVTVLPWHRSIVRAKSRYLDHAETWNQVFDGMANGKDVRSVDRQIGPTFDAAMRALRRAVPPLPLNDLRRRIRSFDADGDGD